MVDHDITVEFESSDGAFSNPKGKVGRKISFIWLVSKAMGSVNYHP